MIIHKNKYIILFLIIALLLAGYYFQDNTHKTVSTKSKTVAQYTIDLSRAQQAPPVNFSKQIKPILDHRCVVCHGCYDAPCQLKLTSAEGLKRGANKKDIYDTKRIIAAQPTRLFVDAKSTQEWRNKGFHSILNEGENSEEKNLKNSVLYQLLQLKRQYPQPNTNTLPESYTLGLKREQSCTTQDSISDFINKHPQWGMPYAMQNLSEDEYNSLVTWIAQGSKTPTPPEPSLPAKPMIKKWETFLNKPNNKQRLVSRYLYEHLFHAHIHFANSSKREFYRLVRSSTKPGEIINEIATIRPYDNPGENPFYYRLQRYAPSVVVKNHLVYEFSDKKLQRYRELFLDPDYQVTNIPSYKSKIASNPFKSFQQLPIKSRYQFLLDNSRFFIEGFVKGPVCRGQIALNVIEDQFWVLFFDPEQDVFTNRAIFIDAIADDLQLPSDTTNSFNILSIWTDYWKKQKQFMLHKQEMFSKINKHSVQHSMNYIWDGDATNPNAALTIFRHFDSATVAYGLVGSNPETTWVMDYPLFERIHYLLVAGYNVYGNIVHQVNTRTYMDFLRMEGEDYFLTFLPVKERKTIRDSWYTGLRTNVKKYFKAPDSWLNVESVTGYKSENPQKELYQLIRDRLSSTANISDLYNRCGGYDCPKPVTKNTNKYNQIVKRVDQAMQKIAKMKGEKLHALADISFVRITSKESEQTFAYTLIRNKAYKNVTSFLADERERDRTDISKDTMTVVNWLEGSYPNFFFSVQLSELDAFVESCASIKNQNDYDTLVTQYGISRTNPEYWKTSDWFHQQSLIEKPVRSGIFDLNRYFR